MRILAQHMRLGCSAIPRKIVSHVKLMYLHSVPISWLILLVISWFNYLPFPISHTPARRRIGKFFSSQALAGELIKLCIRSDNLTRNEGNIIYGNWTFTTVSSSDAMFTRFIGELERDSRLFSSTSARNMLSVDPLQCCRYDVLYDWRLQLLFRAYAHFPWTMNTWAVFQSFWPRIRAARTIRVLSESSRLFCLLFTV